jgi:hypothetical protein
METTYPDWLEFHSLRFQGPVANVRSRSGVVRVELGELEKVDRVLVGIPDDDAWLELAQTIDETEFWDWPHRTEHREPHQPGDWYWWLEVRWDGKRHLAAGWKESPPGFERVQTALYDLVEQVVK